MYYNSPLALALHSSRDAQHRCPDRWGPIYAVPDCTLLGCALGGGALEAVQNGTRGGDDFHESAHAE
eukprot:65853-Rhodomonas_salina.2